MIYRGYKIEKSPCEKIGWNLFERVKYTNGIRWVWLWAYDSEQEAKEAADRHYEYVN